jgi:hypothetical protein
MNTIKGLLGRKEFQLLLFHVCLVLFGWPVVTFNDVERLQTIFVYLFAAWAAVIFLLFMVSRSVGEAQPFQESGNSPER